MTAAEASYPLAIQLEVEFLDRMSEPVREGKVKSVSDLIRSALDRFDLDKIVVAHAAHLTISVRLPAELRRNLKRAARTKHTSIGHLVRAAVEAYLPQLEAQPAGQMEMPMTVEQPAAATPATKSRRPKAGKRPSSRPGRGKPAGKKPAGRGRQTSRKSPAMTKKRKG